MVTDSLSSARVRGEGRGARVRLGAVLGLWSSRPRAGHRKRLRAEVVAGAAGQRWPELAERDGGKLAKHLLRVPRLGLMLSELCVCEDSFHSSVLKKRGTGSCTYCCREAGAVLRAGQRSSRASAPPSRLGLPACFCCEFSQLWGTADIRFNVRAMIVSHFRGWGRSGCVKAENIYRF